jgi:hypothetical protein
MGRFLKKKKIKKKINVLRFKNGLKKKFVRRKLNFLCQNSKLMRF